MKKIALLIALSFSGFLAQGQTTLEYSLNEGDVFLIKQNAKQIITQELDGAAHELINLIDGMMEFQVKEVRDTTYAIDITFKDLNLNMSSSIQGELMNVHAKEVIEGDVQSKIFNSLLNVPIRMILAKNGDVLEVTGGDSLVNKMANESGIEDEFSLNLMKKSLEKEFGTEALSHSYEQMTYIYPSAVVQIGDSWENAYAGKQSSTNVWTLDSIDDSGTHISGSADIIMDLKEPATTMYLTGTQSTSIVADNISGFIKKMEVEGFSEGTSTLTQLGDQKIPTTIKSIITYELIRE